jgi:hypothetical protein
MSIASHQSLVVQCNAAWCGSAVPDLPTKPYACSRAEQPWSFVLPTERAPAQHLEVGSLLLIEALEPSRLSILRLLGSYK